MLQSLKTLYLAVRDEEWFPGGVPRPLPLPHKVWRQLQRTVERRDAARDSSQRDSVRQQLLQCAKPLFSIITSW